MVLSPLQWSRKSWISLIWDDYGMLPWSYRHHNVSLALSAHLLPLMECTFRPLLFLYCRTFSHFSVWEGHGEMVLNGMYGEWVSRENWLSHIRLDVWPWNWHVCVCMYVCHDLCARFEHHVTGYRGPTLLFVLFQNFLCMLAVDCPWKWVVYVTVFFNLELW